MKELEGMIEIQHDYIVEQADVIKTLEWKLKSLEEERTSMYNY